MLNDSMRRNTASPIVALPITTYGLIHPEDEGEWRHWDTQDQNGKKGAWPQNKRKPWPGQKKPAKPPQCDQDPSGDAAPWVPPEIGNIPDTTGNGQDNTVPFTAIPEWLPPPMTPIRIPFPAFVFP